MKVKIISSENTIYWYNDRIGEVFKVLQSQSHDTPCNYRVYREDILEYSFISKCDCEVVKDFVAVEKKKNGKITRKLLKAVAKIDPIAVAYLLGDDWHEHSQRYKSGIKIDTIISAFHWSKTPQGSEFWSNIHDEIVEKESK